MRTKMQNPVDAPKMVDPDQDADDMMNDHETQGHLRTIIDAHQIMSDPDKMAKVHALAGRHQQAIKSLKDVKAAYDKKFGGPAAPAPQDNVVGQPLKVLGKSAVKGMKPQGM